MMTRTLFPAAAAVIGIAASLGLTIAVPPVGWFATLVVGAVIGARSLAAADSQERRGMGDAARAYRYRSVNDIDGDDDSDCF